jgi:hypothetical protein
LDSKLLNLKETLDTSFDPKLPKLKTNLILEIAKLKTVHLILSKLSLIATACILCPQSRSTSRFSHSRMARKSTMYLKLFDFLSAELNS